MNKITPTPLDLVPLHGWPLSGHWACSEPERPWDRDTIYDFRCRACWLHARAVLASTAVDPVAPTVHGGGEGIFAMSEMVAAATYLHTP